MVYWSVARPSKMPGEVLIRSGYIDGDDAAFAQIVVSGIELVASPDGAQPMIWATLSAAHALVESFGQTSEFGILEGEVRRRLREAYERECATPYTPRIHRPEAAGHARPDTTVREQWARIDDWIHTHVPGIEITGASPEAIDAAMTATGQQWPRELVDLFGHIDGIPPEPWISLLPRQQFLSLDDALADREAMIHTWDEGARLYGMEPLSIPPRAGEMAGTFIPAFIPFAGLDSSYLCVDTRPGPLSGCVVDFDKSGADAAGPKWVSITAMLAELADSLTAGGDFEDGWRPVTGNNTVEWEHDRSWAVKQLVLRSCQ